MRAPAPAAGVGAAAAAGPPDPIDVLAAAPGPEAIRELLHAVIDPEIGIDIVELGLLREVEVDGAAARVLFTVTTPACPLSSYIEDEIRACLWGLPGLTEINVELTHDPPWHPEQMSDLAREELGWPS
ncbi:MAG: metal-sulfur cluster assembly factor [Acidobacteria bacterium]|nr:MAG: metal-sulfur cluster assembly factor [Acidobacteriota bacterium]GIK78805.1 MAG: hypothetical protein BroJett022_24950 [Actinomycetes bacterium]